MFWRRDLKNTFISSHLVISKTILQTHFCYANDWNRQALARRILRLQRDGNWVKRPMHSAVG